MEQSLYRALVFNHSATNMQSFLLNSSKFISAVSGSQRDSQHKIEVSNQILHPPMSSDQMPSLPGKKRRQMRFLSSLPWYKSQYQYSGKHLHTVFWLLELF